MTRSLDNMVRQSDAPQPRLGLARMHGGSAPDELHAEYLDLSTCIDGFGVLEPVAAALRRIDESEAYTRYPEQSNRVVRGGLAQLFRCEVAELDVGPGAAEILWSLVRTVAADCVGGRRRPLRALTWEPCFSEFAHAVQAVGGTTSKQHWHEGESVASALQLLSHAIDKHSPQLVYICAPTSPRGQWVPAALLEQLTRAHGETTFVIDQSYLSLSTHAEERHVAFPPNAVRVRSLTKELCTPGVRVGCAIMAPELRRRLQMQRPAWTLGAHAQAVAEVYPHCQALLVKRAGLLRRHALELAAQVNQLGLNAQMQDTHYFLVKHAHAERIVRELWTRERVHVRDCASFGLPTAFRVVAHPQQTRLIQALKRIGDAFVDCKSLSSSPADRPAL